MINFLHTFHPSPILFSLGPINIYWYGLFFVLGILAALTVSIRLTKRRGLKAEIIIDLTIWLVIGGVIGARLYDVVLELPYYLANHFAVFKLWQGGLAIHGGLIGGLIALWLYAKKHQQDFWQLAAVIATALPLAQAVGRWGNYFNQELFGRPTNLPWGLPIDAAHRPWPYLNYDYFQPTFLYESLGDLLIFLILLLYFKKRAVSYELQVMGYAVLYSLVRFFTEFIRLDATPIIFGLRFPQVVSLLIIISCLIYFTIKFGRKISQNKALEKNN